MSSPYKYIAFEIKDTHNLYQRLIKAGIELDEDDKIQKRKIDKLYNVVIELEEERKK
ncbi:hypothetical protein [Lactococcus lactis]|uniref:hypothetical protein n=1 Tax=Lactococcus lactis TaxID=1358 RepID=UPI002891EE70|nr:hypothetical protein [Lactococcus lactis]MDT2904831.1 hypothetical protein [Lactococcus lactis]MDT2911339.1 hypothetical protein [Lactococcus lactis]MDT2933008.1 hypothetical protein [Lactococcus lactis]MDT2937876.1 hypothetical protein [Lactococcus lactis]